MVVAVAAPPVEAPVATLGEDPALGDALSAGAHAAAEAAVGMSAADPDAIFFSGSPRPAGHYCG